MSHENFESALCDLTRKARDGRGLPVMLHHGPLTAEALRASTRDLMRFGIDRNVVFLDLTGGDHTQGIESQESEAAYWENIALLARATAAAIKAGA